MKSLRLPLQIDVVRTAPVALVTAANNGRMTFLERALASARRDYPITHHVAGENPSTKIRLGIGAPLASSELIEGVG